MLKHILVHIDASDGIKKRLDTAIRLATSYDAHLTGLFAQPPLVIPTFDGAYFPASIIDDQENAAQAAADKAEALFKAATDQAACSAEWRCVQGAADRHINKLACNVDLVIVGQTKDRRVMSGESLVDEYVVLGSPSPVLVIPHAGAPATIGTRIVIGWNDSRESAHAVQGAMPLLKLADKVDVIAVNPPHSEGDIPTADICQQLARHGIAAEGSQTVARDLDSGTALLSRATDMGCDLIVMGAYGHTRLRETVLGGVTRTVLENMAIPVLMRH